MTTSRFKRLILAARFTGTDNADDTITLDLANTGPGVTGPIGSTSAVPVVTIDAKGRVTALGSAAPQIDTIGAGTDITTNDVTTTKHGLVPKSPGDNAKFLRGGNPPTWEPVGGVTSVVATDAIWDAKGDTAIGSGADAASRLAVGANDTVLTADSSQTLGVKWAVALSADGWAATSGLSYSSADSPTFVAATSSDLTALIGVGDRIKLTQTTVKFFIVTAIDSTTMTLYGGTDYTLANVAITSPYYSHQKAPTGFPVDPAKWTITVVTDTSQRLQANPVAGTWYNVGTLTGAIHIGAWDVSLKATPFATRAAAGALDPYVTLSTGNNTQGIADLTTLGDVRNETTFAFTFQVRARLLIAAKTSYFVNVKVTASTNTNVGVSGNLLATNVYAVCAYL